MNVHERRELYLHRDTNENNLCAYCRHYCPHYVLLDCHFLVINTGHCLYPRLKLRAAYDICEKFERK